MSLRVEWFEDAEEDLKRLPDWRLADNVDAAVMRLANGVGFVLHVMHTDAPDEFRLLIPKMRTYVRIRRSPTTIFVERVIYRP